MLLRCHMGHLQLLGARAKQQPESVRSPPQPLGDGGFFITEQGEEARRS